MEETYLRIHSRKLEGVTQAQVAEAVDTKWNFVREIEVMLKNVKPIRSRTESVMTNGPIRIVPIS